MVKPYEHPAAFQALDIISHREDLMRGYVWRFRITAPDRAPVASSGKVALTGTVWMPMQRVVFDCGAFRELDDLAYWVLDRLRGRQMAYLPASKTKGDPS